MVVYNMGLACNILEQTKEALTYLERASRLDNDIFEVEMTAGNLLLKAGRLDAALVHLSRQNSSMPEQPYPIVSLESTFLEHKN